jgi:threonine/homoserine efflux transporter RhtA
MRIKSGVWHWLAAGCIAAGLLYGMGIEGGAQLGGVITDGEYCTAIGLLAAAVVFMRLGFAAQDREKQTKKIHQQPGNTVQRSRRAG